MNLLRTFPLMAFALVMLSIIGFCIAQPSPSLGLLVVAGTLGALSWYVTEGPRGRSLPRWVSNLLTVAVAIGVVGDLLDNLGPNGDVMAVLGRFTVWLTLIKLYERKTPRDYAQILALSMLLMLVGCLQTVKLVFGLVLLLYAILGLHVLMQHQFYLSFERAKTRRGASIPAGFRLTPSVQPIFGRHAGLQLRGLLAGIVVLGLALSSVVFVLAPRTAGRPVWRQDAAGLSEPESDFSEAIDLTTGTRITTSQRIVATMRLLDASGEPARLNRPLLLRGAVLTNYLEGGRWRAARPSDMHDLPDQPGSVVDLTAFPIAATIGARSVAKAVLVQEFTFLPRDRAGQTRALFSLPVPIRLLKDVRARLRIHPATQMMEHTDHGWLRSYKIWAAPEVDDETFGRLWRSSEPPMPNQPFRSPRVRELAEQLLERAGLPTIAPADPGEVLAWRRRAADVFRGFLQSPRFSYDTDLSDVASSPGSRSDPIERFLLETRRGHCEYFASAMTALCHSVDIPARLVTGFAAVEYDPSAQRYIIRESSAHAWTEVLTGEHLWATIDPTPPGTLGDVRQSGASFADWLRSLYGTFELSWLSNVVFFDARSQAQLVEQVSTTWSARAGAMLTDLLEWMQQVNRSFDLGPTGYLWLGLVAFAGLLAVAAAVKVSRRLLRLRALAGGRRPDAAVSPRYLRQLGFYLDMLQALDRFGRAKPSWQPPLAFAEDLARAHPALAESVRELSDLFYAARYGQRLLQPAEHARAQSQLQSLLARLTADG